MKTRHALIAGLALIGLTNAIALAGVWYNRSGEPDSVLELSERELHRSQDWSQEENSGLALRLDWRRPRDTSSDDRYQRLQLDERRLLDLGFSAPTADGVHHSSQSREVLVVLELNGPARKAELARARGELQKALAELQAAPQDKRRQEAERNARSYLDLEEKRESRLFAVDAGLDREALRNRYPDRRRYAILPGSVNAWVRQDGQLTGQISRLRVTAINVPHAWRQALDQALRHEPEGERPGPFRVRISFGQRLEPWMDEAPEIGQEKDQGKPPAADSLASSTRP